jgi:hypothetical protein
MGVWNGRRDLLFCANYPGHDGELTHVSGGGIVVDCRRFCRKWETTPAEVSGSEGVRYIRLGQGRAVMVDAADFEWLNKHKWRGAGGPTGYAIANIGGRQMAMHRLIMNPPEGSVVDHINGNRHDNRRSNLRVCTLSENCRNSRKSCGTSRFKGVSWSRTAGKWQARIWYHGKSTYLGYFDDEIEAAMAYDRKARELFGAFACLNFPGRGRIVRLSGRICAHSHARGRIRVSKSETTPNHQNLKLATPSSTARPFGSLKHLDFGRCFRNDTGPQASSFGGIVGFRISDFESPQLSTGPPADHQLLFDNFILGSSGTRQRYLESTCHPERSASGVEGSGCTCA